MLRHKIVGSRKEVLSLVKLGMLTFTVYFIFFMFSVFTNHLFVLIDLLVGPESSFIVRTFSFILQKEEVEL